MVFAVRGPFVSNLAARKHPFDRVSYLHRLRILNHSASFHRRSSSWMYKSENETVPRGPALVPVVARAPIVSRKPVVDHHETISGTETVTSAAYPDLSCLFELPKLTRSEQQERSAFFHRLRGLFPDALLKTSVPRHDSRLLDASSFFILFLAGSVHLLPALSIYEPAREIITVVIRAVALHSIASCGGHFGFMGSRYGWPCKMSRLQIRESSIRGGFAGIGFFASMLVVALADFAARDASYFMILVLLGLTGGEYVAGRRRLQPKWVFYYVTLLRLTMVVCLLLCVTSKESAIWGHAMDLIPRSRPGLVVAPVLDGETISIPVLED